MTLDADVTSNELLSRAYDGNSAFRTLDDKFVPTSSFNTVHWCVMVRL